MTQSDFYLLKEQTIEDQWLFACRLVDQLVTKEGRQVLVQLDDRQQAAAFDDLLWTYRADSFVPHALLDAQDAPIDCQVSIGWLDDPGHQHDVLINLSQVLPNFFSRFQRLCEVVVQHDLVLEYTRNHFRFLKDRGYPLKATDMPLQHHEKRAR